MCVICQTIVFSYFEKLFPPFLGNDHMSVHLWEQVRDLI